MATLQELERAFLKAHEAGDKENAQILANEIRRFMAPPTPEEPQPQPQTGFVPNVKAGVERLKGDYYAFLAGMGQPGAAEEAERYRQKAAQIATVPEFTDKPFEFLKSVAGGSVPYMAAPLAAGLAATPLGVPAAIGASGLASAGQFTGSFLSRQLEEGTRPEDLQVGKAAAAAVPAAALDVIGFRYIPGIRKIFGSAGVQIGNKEAAGIVEKYITPAFKAAGVEGGTEAAQQVLERMQAGLSITDPEARKEYFDSFVAGAVLGGALSVPGSMLERPGAAPTEPPPPPGAPTTEEPAVPPTATAPEMPALPQLPAPERGIPLGYTPTKALPAPPEKVDIYKLMDSHDTLKSSLDPLADQIEKARQEGDNETARTLMQEYRDNEAAMNALATQITEAGGVLESAEEAEAAYNKQLKTLDSKIAKEQNTITEMSRADVRDYDAVDKAEKRLAKLQAERGAAEEEFQRKRGVLRVKETPPGEQISLFDTEEQQPKAEEVLKFKTEKGEEFTAADIEKMTQGPVQTTALSKDTENQIAQKQAEADDLLKQIVAMSPRVSSENVEIGGPKRATDTERQSVLDRLNEARQKYRDLQEQEGKLSEASAQPGYYDNMEAAKGSVRRQITELERELERMAPRNVNRKFLKDYYDKSNQLNKIYGEIDALNAAPVEQTKQPVDIFDYANQLRTATLNNDPKTIMAIINQLKKEGKVIPEATRERAEKKAGERAQRGMSEKDKLVQTLGQRLGLPGRISERTVTEEEYQRIADRISYLMDMVDKPVGRAKMSVKDKVEKLGREIAGLTETLKNKDLPPTTRQGASKSRNAKVKEYNHLIENVMVPARDEIFALYRSMFTVKEVAPVGSAEKMLAADAEKTRKDLLKEFEERVENYGPESPQVREFVEKNLSVKMSPQYKRYKKIIEGKGITASPKRVAMEIGRETDEYKKFAAPKEKEIAKRKAAYEKYEADAKAELAKLKERVGETSEDYKNRVNEYTKGAKQKLDAWKNFEKAATKAMDAKAEELGKASPEYRSRKLKATEKYREAVAAGEQEIETKRTTQATRKVAKLSRMQTASEESRARTRTIQEKQEPGLLPSQAGEKPEVPFKPKAEPKSASAMLSAFQAAATKRLKETGKLQRGSEIESKDLTDKQVDALKNNDLKTAFASIVEDDTNIPVNRAVAAALEVYVDETNVTVSDRVYYPPTGEEVLGMATAGQIDISRLGLTQETLLHEGVHSAAERVIQMAKDDITLLSPTQQAAYRELERLFKAIQKDPTITSVNAKSDISEFAAEALSNENLQNQLRSKPWTLGNAFRSFVSYILQMIGVKNVKNMMEASIAAVEALMVPTSVARAEVTETAKAMPKGIGVKEEKPGVFSFKSYVQPGATPSSIVADEPRTVDTLKANFLGIAGRVQFVDKFAAISEAFKKGMDAKKISQLEASNGEYYLRFGENRSQYAQQALTNGPLSRVVSRETPEGKEYIYRSEAGANLMRVFEILEGAGIKNSTELDRMFTVYQAGKRAKQVGWEKLWVGNPAKAKAEYDAVMAQLKNSSQMRDAFEAASKEYKKFNDGLIDFVVQTGAMTKDQADKLKSIDYVPYYRVNKGSGDVELFTDKEVPIRIGNIKDEPQLQQLVGDNTQILPLSVSSVQNAFMLVDMGLRNQRVKDTSFLLHKIGFAKTLAKGEGPANRDTVRFKFKGEPYYAIIDTDLYGIPADLIVKGMEGIKTSLPMGVKAMGVPADILRKFVTRNPAYAIRQAIRDPLTAWMTTGTDGVPIFNSFKQLSSMVAGRSETERKLMETGAISSNVFTGGPEDFKRFLRDISAGKSGWEKLMAKADAFAMQGDAATRAVVYEDSIAKGLSEQQALLRTLESMNFGRRGLSPTMYYLNTLIPFFNAQIQGLDVLYRAFTNKMPYSEQLKIREKLIARGLLMGAATLAYAAMMQDDEAYKRAKPEERLANWFVYIPGMDQPLKVPIPFELGYLFKSLPEAVFNMGAADEKSKDITKGMGKLMMMSNPVALPQAVKPVTELYLGKSFFGGDIESQREQKNMLPTERFRSTTTELSKVLGGATGDAGITPIGWDHLIRGYTGGLGIALVSLANPILNTEASAIEQPSKKLHQTPFVGGLFQPVEGRGTLDAAYERMLEIQQAKGTFNQLMQQGKREEAQAFLDAYRNKVVAASLSGTMQQRLGELATMRRRIVEMPNMPQEKKDEILERIDDQQIMLARRFLEATNETKPQADRP